MLVKLGPVLTCSLGLLQHKSATQQTMIVAI